MANTLKAWLTDNTVTADPNDKILVLESTGKADLDKVLEEMQAEDTGLRPETQAHVVALFQRKCAQLLMNGYQLNTGLFYAVPRFTGVVESGKWNPEKNDIYVSMVQGKVLREEIAKTSVHILGEKNNVMYILEVEDRKSGYRDGKMTPGHNLFVRGACLKVGGEHAAVGVSLTNSKGAVTKLDEDAIVVNNPSELTLLIPAGLAEDTYELAVCTQLNSGRTLLKEPRTVTVPVYVGTPAGDKPEEL